MVCALVLRVKEPHVINLSLPFSFKEKPLFDVWLLPVGQRFFHLG